MSLFNVLLIEDDPMQQKLMQFQFNYLGAKHPVELHIVRDGIEAQEFLGRSLSYAVPRPHLILLDLNMPRMDGQTFLVWLRQEADPQIRTLPVVVLSTSDRRDERFKAHQQHIAAFVTKPYEMARLREFLEAIEGVWVRFALEHLGEP